MIISTGSAQRIMIPNLTFRVSIMIIPPKNSRLSRTNILNMKSTICWIAVISAVRRVTNEPVVNLSVCSKERPMTRLKTSTRRSLEKLWEAIPPNAEAAIPQAPPPIRTRSMRSPVLMIRSIS